MRWILLLALANLVLPSMSHSQEPIPWANKLFTKEAPVPQVISHDFGTVPFGTLLTHRFKITNIYAVPIQITNISKSCGCVNAIAPVPVLQPRESATIDVTMDARRFTGPKTVTIQVTVGPQFVSTAVLQVSAVSRADVMLTPGQVHFGIVPQGQRPTQIIDVQYNGNRSDWRITQIVNHQLPVDVRTEMYRSQNRPGYRIYVTLKENAPAGSLQEQLMVETNDPANPLIPIPIVGVIQAPLTVTQSVVRFDPLAVGQSATRRIMVLGNDKPFKITKIEGEGDGITVELPPVSMSRQILSIKFQPQKIGEVARDITLKTDLGEGSTIKIRVEGVGESP